MKFNSFKPGRNSKPNSELTIVNDWTDLSNYNFVDDGSEILLNNISVTNTEKTLVRKVDGKWIVPGSSNEVIEYTNNNRIFQSSLTTPKNFEIIGKNLEYFPSPTSISDLTNSIGNQSSACTFSIEIKNISKKTVKSFRFLFPTTSNNNCRFYGKFAVKGTGTEKNPSGPWYNITWDGVNNIKPPNSNQTDSRPLLILSDAIEVPTGVLSGQSIILWISCEGASDVVQTLAMNTEFYFPSFFKGGNFGVGNFCLTSANNQTWANVSYLGHPISHIVCEYFDKTPIINIVTVGDSAFSERVSLGADNETGNGWNQVANEISRVSGFGWRLACFSQGGAGTDVHVQRLRSILESDLKQFIDVIVYQNWSGNNVPNNITEYNNCIGYLNEARSLCSSANVSFTTLCIYPSTLGEYFTNPEVSAFAIQGNIYYNDMKAYVSANDYNYMDISYCVTSADGLNYNYYDSTDNSHALMGSYENQIGQYKQGVTIVGPMNDMLTRLKYI